VLRARRAGTTVYLSKSRDMVCQASRDLVVGRQPGLFCKVYRTFCKVCFTFPVIK